MTWRSSGENPRRRGTAPPRRGSRAWRRAPTRPAAAPAAGCTLQKGENAPRVATRRVQHTVVLLDAQGSICPAEAEGDGHVHAGRLHVLSNRWGDARRREPGGCSWPNQESRRKGLPPLEHGVGEDVRVGVHDHRAQDSLCQDLPLASRGRTYRSLPYWVHLWLHPTQEAATPSGGGRRRGPVDRRIDS